jgi:beta-glucanase (GH16 family)
MQRSASARVALAACLLGAGVWGSACGSNDDTAFDVPPGGAGGDAGGTGSQDAGKGGGHDSGAQGTGDDTGAPVGRDDASSGGDDGSSGGSQDGSSTPAPEAGGNGDDASVPGWQLTWSDEFNTADGTQPDPAKWTYDIGDGTAQGAPGWGNAELEYYTNRPDNVVIRGGSLVITAMQSTDASLKCNGKTCGYTSGRIHTQGKFSQTYGRFEARIKIPSGSGVWPAFWMMGDQFTQANWPQYGEIDVMENAGSLPYETRGSIHGPGGSAKYTDEGLTAPYDLPMSSKVSDDFHVFAMEWDVDTISFFFDSTKYFTVTAADVVNVGQGATWPFNDDPNFLLLDFAVDSGNFGDPPNAQTKWPQQMLVDYVRVYKKM